MVRNRNQEARQTVPFLSGDHIFPVVVSYDNAEEEMRRRQDAENQIQDLRTAAEGNILNQFKGIADKCETDSGIHPGAHHAFLPHGRPAGQILQSFFHQSRTEVHIRDIP